MLGRSAQGQPALVTGPVVGSLEASHSSLLGVARDETTHRAELSVPSPQDWMSAKYLAHFVVDVVKRLDEAKASSKAEAAPSGRSGVSAPEEAGRPAEPPSERPQRPGSSKRLGRQAPN